MKNETRRLEDKVRSQRDRIKFLNKKIELYESFVRIVESMMAEHSIDFFDVKEMLSVINQKGLVYAAKQQKGLVRAT